MHELSLITNVVDSLYEVFEKQPIRRVKSVTLSVGTVSGVVPHYLTDAWAWFVKDDELFKQSELKQRSLSAPAVPDKRNISDLFACIYLHALFLLIF